MRLGQGFITSILAAALAFSANAAEFKQPEPRYAELTKEQAAAAKFFMDFTVRMTADVQKRVAKLNGADVAELKTTTTEPARYDIITQRGDVFVAL